MPCSAITLSLATITAIVSVAMLAIAFSTDNWLYIDVKRSSILVIIIFFYVFLYGGLCLNYGAV